MPCTLPGPHALTVSVLCHAVLPTQRNRVPGVSLPPGALPAGGCRADSDCLDSSGIQQDPNLMCNITTSVGDVCVCDQLSGTDTCTKYSGCVRTPCAVCSVCLTQLVQFTVTQLYNQNATDIAANLRTFCAASKAWSAAQCAAAVEAVASNKPSFGKRAGNVCQALGVCGAPGAAALGSGCLLKVSVPAYGDKAAATPALSALDLCAVEGLSSGTDVPGTTRLLSLPLGLCPPPAKLAAGDNLGYGCHRSFGNLRGSGVSEADGIPVCRSVDTQQEH